MASPAYAELIDLGNGLIYDPLQDLTFAQDVRLARTLGQDDDGLFNWSHAQSWVAGLTYAGYDDWRLPDFFGGSPELLEQNGTSEISRMMVHLGWSNRSNSWGDYYPGGTGPFINLTTGYDSAAWLNEYLQLWIVTWQYDIPDRGPDSLHIAWAVRDGGNPMARVPEPSSLILIVLGAATASLARRARKRAIIVPIAAAICFLSAPRHANASLIDLGNGLIYDTVQDLTWVQDLALSRTLGHDEDGRLTQAQARAWAEALVFGDYDDWRLPNMVQVANREEGNSETSRLFYQLGWQIEADRYRYVDETTLLRGPFLNYGQIGTVPQYWFGNRDVEAWHALFVFDPPDDGPDALLGAWAVRDGGNPMARVPEPSVLLLVLIGAAAFLPRA